MKDSIIAGAAATAVASTGLAAATSSAAVQTEAKHFKLCVSFGDVVERPPGDICSGWDMSEIPIQYQLIPTATQEAWVRKQAEIASWKLPPIKVSSHFVGGVGVNVTGADVDTEWHEFWLKRAFPRLAEVGVEIAGVYGGFFPVPEGFSKTKARDQALRYFNQVADHARRHGILIAIEPMGSPTTVFPTYLDGLAFAREIGRPEIRVMADMTYFVRYDQPLEDTLKAPEYCIHWHISGVKGQPGVGDLVAYHTRLFQMLRDSGYTRAVSTACPWVDTTGSGKLNMRIETTKTLQYLRDLRDKVYSKG